MRMRYRTLFMILFFFVFCSIPLPVWGQSDSKTEFSAEKAYDHIVHLSQKIGPRPAGSKNEEKAAEYLYYMLEQYGWKVREQPFSKIVSQPNPLQPENKIQVINSQNIIAELPGKNQESILLGAHYDSADISVPGAVDNASGVGVLLELARILGQSEHTDSYQIVFFGAEEYGLVGSSYYVAQTDISAVRWMLNLDMIGTPLEIDIAGKKSAPPELVRQVSRIVQNAKIPFHVSRDFMVMTRDGVQGGNSDFSSFLDQGIPAVGFGIEGRPGGFYHRPEDQIEQVSLRDLEKIGNILTEIVHSVQISATGPRTWDEFYLPFQMGSNVFILPTFGVRLFFILVLFFTGFTLLRALKQERSSSREPLTHYLSIGVALPLAALFVVALSGTGEFVWQHLKGKETLWYAFPGIILAMRIIAAICLTLLVTIGLLKIPRPNSGKFYWVAGTVLLLLISVILGFYRIDLAFPFLFWLLCFDLLFFFPNFILIFIGPYFIYKSHWELLNSQQWVSFYETAHQYALVFIVLYALFLIPFFLAGLFIIKKARSSWKKIALHLPIPAVIGVLLVVLSTGLIPNYTKDYPQTVTVRKEWSEDESVKLKISSKDNLPKKLLKEFNGSSGRSIEVPMPTEKPPMSIQTAVTQTGERLLNLTFSMNYSREPYLVRIKLESPKPFIITRMDEFLPISKLPRKIRLEGKERNGRYSLILERTPPQKSQIQWTIEAPGTVWCTVETLFADGNPKILIQNENLSPNYEEFYQTTFEF